jgi:hypothetical protein
LHKKSSIHTQKCHYKKSKNKYIKTTKIAQQNCVAKQKNDTKKVAQPRKKIITKNFLNMVEIPCGTSFAGMTKKSQKSAIGT